jgi:hypothetical protein
MSTMAENGGGSGNITSNGDTTLLSSSTVAMLPSPSAGGIASAPNSGNTPNKAAMQMQKMKDANTKYKNLLKMAKERIEQQEQELKTLRGTSSLEKESLDSVITK